MNITLDPKLFRIERTTRGAPCLIFENYKFRYGNKMRDEIRWRCTNKMCKATIKTNHKGITEKRTNHDHEPHPEKSRTAMRLAKIGQNASRKRKSYFLPTRAQVVDCRGNRLETSGEENASGSNQGIKLLQNEAGELIMVNETPTHFMNLLWRLWEGAKFECQLCGLTFPVVGCGSPTP